MNNAEIIEQLLAMDMSNPKVVNDLLDMAITTADKKLGLKVRDIAITEIATNGDAIEFNKIYRRALQFLAPIDFDSYMIYLEIDRQAHERFYLPRRKILKRAVDELQRLTDNELDELFLSMPPRVGKTTLLVFFATWIIGRNSELSNLYSAYSDTITEAFYNGLLEIIEDPMTYKWNEIFQYCSVKGKNASKETLDINRKKRYPSITCRSLYGTLNGACDCNGMLISDDLIGGIEEALNKGRLDSAWAKVDNNLIPRAKMSAKRLWVGTRWSIYDPAGRRMDMLTSDERFNKVRFEIINLPALDENDESNFTYGHGVGFDTEYYHQRRASFEHNNDMASWLAQYMGEPIEREGTLFTPDSMNFYNGVLPDGEPDRIFAFCDVAWGGGDFLSFPVAYQYDDKVYIPDVVFDKSDKTVTRIKVANKILTHKIRSAEFEKNNGGGEYQEWIEEYLRKEKRYTLNIISRVAPSNKRKEERIYEASPEIRDFYFLESGKRDSEYNLFIQNLFSFKLDGKNKNDDAPDSLSGLANMIRKADKNTVQVINRFF